MTRLHRTTHSEHETESFAAEIARQVTPPLVLLLEGELGAGKTAFVRGFVRALPGGEGVVVQSPTFALARSYPTTPPVHHLDLYRLADARGLEELGLMELLRDQGAFSLVEWMRDLALPGPVGCVRIATAGEDADRREIAVELPDAGDA